MTLLKGSFNGSDSVDFAKSQDALSHQLASTAQRQATVDGRPILLTVLEAACLLRTSTRAIYAMVERRQLPGVVRLRRRLLFRTEVLLDWVDQKSAPLPKE